jgi:hypothetical protein
MGRRVGFPVDFLGVEPSLFFDPGIAIPEFWMPRGRWKSGPMHLFCDDYRQDFFWRRPMEGVVVALNAICPDGSAMITAPDFSVFSDDPAEWALYQCWRSALVGTFISSFGVNVIPVVAFRGFPERFVRKGSVWAVRGPSRYEKVDFWLHEMGQFESRASPSLIVVFGNQVETSGVLSTPVIGRKLVSRGGIDGRS